VLAGVDTIEHGPPEPDQELAELMAERRTFLVPTPLLAYSTLSRRAETKLSDAMVKAIEAERDGQKAFMQQAMSAGVKIVLGSDTFARPPLAHLGQNAKVLELLVEWGCTPRQALEAATSNAAEALGYSGTIGTLQAGAFADVLVWNLDPLEHVAKLRDPANLAHVFRSALLLYG
jgi:imidazolonepropionase-like amidohydrolase